MSARRKEEAMTIFISAMLGIDVIWEYEMTVLCSLQPTEDFGISAE